MSHEPYILRIILLSFTETFKWIALESIVGGHLRQMKDNLYSFISWSCHSFK